MVRATLQTANAAARAAAARVGGIWRAWLGSAKCTGVKIADGKGRRREEFKVIEIKVSPAADESGCDYYYADCCRLGKGGGVPSGGVGPVSGEILPSLRETFYVHHEDESFKHVPFAELVAAYSSDS